ncbi:MAG TPA: PEP-CTERM sorting domain-containing protein [Phycisphaerae bacterium]|nr:PEP-CTERM sorting domain-containing protein [Phycisphaerae bacterium]
MTIKKLSAVLAIAAVLLPVAAQGSPSRLYSLDHVSDQLFTIDTATGATTAVGPLGVDVLPGGDMAYLNGRLYHVMPDASDAANSTHTLFEISPTTGAVLSSQAITVGGSPYIGGVEGLTAVDGKLIVAYAGVPNQPESPLLGELSLTGDIFNPADFSAFNADMDGLATDSAGQIFANDSVPSSDEVFLYRVDRAPLDYSLVGGFSRPAGWYPRVTDITFAGGRLYGVETYHDVMYEIDPTTGGLLAEIAIDPALRLNGLAAPEPTSLALLLTVSVWGLRKRREHRG